MLHRILTHIIQRTFQLNVSQNFIHLYHSEVIILIYICIYIYIY